MLISLYRYHASHAFDLSRGLRGRTGCVQRGTILVALYDRRLQIDLRRAEGHKHFNASFLACVPVGVMGLVARIILVLLRAAS